MHADGYKNVGLRRLLARVEATGARDLLVVFGLFIFGENVFLLKLA